MASSGLWQWFHQWGSPKHFYRKSASWLPWLAVSALLLFAIGFIGGFLLAPADYLQGNSFRIIYFHVPSAFLSLSAYVFMASMGFVSLVWRIKMTDILMLSVAPIGASFTLIALVTGAIWGKPTWGTWWIWDARLTSELILLFLYLGVIALSQAIEDPDRANKSCALLSLVGLVNIPIIHFSVEWWNTLHQGATLSKFAKPSMHPDMLWPLLVMIAAFGCYFVWALFVSARCKVLERQQQSRWMEAHYGV